MRACRGKAVWLLLGAAALLVVVAVVAGVVYLALRGQRDAGSEWQDPRSAVLADQVAPDLALYPLAGAAPVETVDAAIASGELETAYATLVFDSEIPDRQRIGRLISLANQYVAAEQEDRAAVVLNQIHDLAILSPTVNDPIRADALLAEGQAWAALGREQEAQEALDQVHLIAMHSPYLPRAQRRLLLSTLEEIQTELGDEEQARARRDEITALDQETGSPPAADVQATVDLPSGTNPVSSPDVGALEEARRRAAFDLLQELAEGQEPASERLAQMAQSLVNEDAAKLQLYRGVLDTTSQSSKRIDVHWQTIRWLLLKYQVATKGLGLSLVPEWEDQKAEIQSALTKEYEDLLFDYEDLISAMPDAAHMAPGRYHALRLVLLGGRLGAYPSFPAEQLAAKLQSVGQELALSATQPGLLVDAAAEQGAVRFFLSPAGEYGQPAETP